MRVVAILDCSHGNTGGGEGRGRGWGGTTAAHPEQRTERPEASLVHHGCFCSGRKWELVVAGENVEFTCTLAAQHLCMHHMKFLCG